MTRVLLLNPPSKAPVSRDYFLSDSCPGWSLPPADLVAASAALADGFELSVLDAAAERLSSAAALARAARAKPDAVVFLIGAASYAEDEAFLGALKKRLPKARFVGLGDVYRDVGELAFALHPFLDAAALDFASEALARYLETGKPQDDMICRDEKGAPRRGPRLFPREEWGARPARWELFPLARYGWPGAGPGPRASLLTDYGCAFLCGYCPASGMGHRRRPLAAVEAELGALRGLRVRSLFVRDQTFAADEPRTTAVLELLSRSGLEWQCWTRVDLLDDALAGRLKQAGCVAVWLGVDSGDDDVLRAYKKHTTRAQAVAAVGAARRAGLRACGSLLIGLPLDTPGSARRTLDFASELSLDRVEVRLESQRRSVVYRRELLVRGHVPPESMPPDTPASVSVWQGRLGLTNQDAQRLLDESRSPA